MGSVQQQIYASLADESLKAGHHTHAATPGLDAATIERHEEICNHWGQFEAGSPFKRSLVHLPLHEGEGPDPSHHLVILITEQGRDARGRPGAMLRHVVRLDTEAFAAFDHNPFHLWRQGLLLAQWTPQTPFPVIEQSHDPTSRTDLQSIFPERYALLRGLLAHLLASGRLHLHAAEDSPAAEEMLGQILELLPPARRATLALTTFAYANAHEYQLAVVRRADTTLRASLDRYLDEPVEGLRDEDRAYLDRLFAALEAKDWIAAAACVHGEPVPRPETPRPSTGGPVPFSHRRSAAPVAGSDPEDLGAWAPSFRRAGSAPPKKSRRGIWLAALALVVVGVGGFALLQRGGGVAGPDGGRVNTRVEAATDLGALVDAHASRMKTLIDQGSRDFDLTEAMRGMQARLKETVEGTLLRERQALTAGAMQTQGDPTAMALLLRTEADRLALASRRLAALEAALATADLAAVRAAIRPGSGLDLGEAEPSGPVAAPAARWAQELGEAATQVRASGELALPPVAAEWVARAAALRECAPAATAVEALADAVQAQAEVLPSLASEAGRVGEKVSPFERVAASAARDAAENARRQWGGLPPPIAAVDRLLDLGLRASEHPRGAAAVEWMEELGEVTEPGALLAALTTDGPARDWLARWRVEVVRGFAGAPENGVWRGFAAAHAAETTRVAAALEAFAAAPTPAGAELVTRTRQQQGQLQDPLHRALFADWLRRQDQGRARTGSAFEDVYVALKRAHAAFVADPSTSTWTALRTALATAEASGLDVVARDPARRPQVQAIEGYARAVVAPVTAQLGRVRIELLRRSDYSGTERSLAQLRAVLLRRSDAAVLWQAGAPPVLAPPGAAFQQVEIAGTTSFRVGATEGLTLAVRDEKTGMLWAHLWADAAARGHVLDALARTHEIKLSDAQQRGLQQADAPARPDGNGAAVARITVEVSPSFWPALARSLPALP